MALSIEHPASAQVMISWFVGLSPASGSVLTTWDFGAGFRFCVSSLCPSPVRALSPSVSQKQVSVENIFFQSGINNVEMFL